MSKLLDEIRSRGYWEVVIQPHTFIEQRIANVSDLYPILQRCSVRLQIWDFPRLDRRIQPHVDTDWIGQELQWEHHLELWRFYQSGQFVHLAGIKSDWHDRSTLWPLANGWRPGAVLEIGDTVLRFTEIFELAARLAFTDASDDFMHVSVTLKGLKNRALQFDRPNGQPLATEYRATGEDYSYTVEQSRVEFITKPRTLAIQGVRELFERFNWAPSAYQLRGWQEQIRAVRHSA